MKDIDFDELDRAVSSLMSTDQPKPAVGTQASVPVANQSEPARETDSVPEPVAVKVFTQQPSNESTVSAPQKTGRFMDLVSGGAPAGSPAVRRTASSTVAPRTSAPSREGLTIAPRVQAPAPAAVPQATQNRDASESAPVVDIAPLASVQPVAPPITSASESPFLENASVTKRPLNSAPASIDMEMLEKELELESSKENDDTPPVAQVSEPSGLDEPPLDPPVPEHDRQLLEIESDAQTSSSSETSPLLHESEPVTPVQQPSAPITTPNSMPTPLGATSIAQQYTPQPSTGDQSHAAIYDASQYPEPLAHPAKKKSGWLWVVWVILLLGIGAGGTVLLYVLGIIP